MTGAELRHESNKIQPYRAEHVGDAARCRAGRANGGPLHTAGQRGVVQWVRSK